MPGRDGTGPNGLGPLTGNRLGPCAGINQPIIPGRNWGNRMRHGYGFGRNTGRGRGMGFRYGYAFPEGERTDSSFDKTELENEIRILKEQLLSLEERLSQSSTEK